MKTSVFCLSMFFLLFCIVPVQAFFDGPDPIAPPDDARFGPGDAPPVLSWVDISSSGYEIELAIDADFVVTTGPIPVSEAQYDLGMLIPDDVWKPLDISLYWHVRAKQLLGFYGSWSTARCFHKTPFSAPETVTFPDSRYNQFTDMPKFEWESVPDASGYYLAFARDPEFQFPLGEIQLTDTYLDLNNTDRTAWDDISGYFYWRVCAVSATDVPGPWSQICAISKTTIPSPEITTPEDGIVYEALSDPPVLEWNPAGNGAYQIRFSMDAEGRQEFSTLDVSAPVFDFATIISTEDWHGAYGGFYWAVCTFDDAGRPTPWTPARRIWKIGYHRVAAYGDSITTGVCVENGYLPFLDARLADYWDTYSTVQEGEGGTKTKWAAENILDRLEDSNPEFMIIHYGTLDIIDPAHCEPPWDCRTIQNMETILQTVLDRGTIPILSTIIPVDPHGTQAPAQARINEVNAELINLAEELGVPLVDTNAAFWNYDGNMSDLYCDPVHPTMTGYDIMIDGFLDALLSND